MNKKVYNKPEIYITQFECENIMTMSAFSVFNFHSDDSENNYIWTSYDI